MNYNFHMPVRLITGENCIRKNCGLLKEMGERCIIVTGKGSAVRSGALADIQAALESQGIRWMLFDQVKPNPLLEDSHRAAKQAVEFGAQFVVGIGGGSALDAAKATAIFAANPMPVLDVYKGNWPNPVLPIVAVGTTAGTGSEVAPYAVMTKPDGRKESISNAQCFPRISFGDPKYTYSLPWKFTVSTALDALSHAVEGYFGAKANDITDFYAKGAIEMLWKALSQLEETDPEQEVPHPLREQLYYASVMAGIVLAHCGTTYCHRLGYFLSEDFDVPHGTACAVYLPSFLERAERYQAGKCRALEQAVGCTLGELDALIRRLTDMEPVKVSAEFARDLAKTNAGCGNFNNSIPAFEEQEAVDMLMRMYVE